MRYAVLADIHANLEALSAVMDGLAEERIDRYLCVGDVVGYGASPVECLARLQASGAVVVGGNHDIACVGKLEMSWFNDTARRALLWTRDQLSFSDLDLLRRFPLTETVGPFTLVHGTLTSPQRFDYLVDLAQAIETVVICRTLFCLAGHTHVPMIVEYDRESRRLTRVLTTERETASVEFHDDGDRWRYLVNPGSVGQPRDGDARASAAVVDMDRKRIAVRRIPYNIAAAQEKIRRAGLPGFLAERLAIGR